MKTIDVVYSPICEANGAFLGQLEEWLEDTDVKINYIPYDSLTLKQMEWYKVHGVIHEKGKLISSVFIDVFYNRKLIDTVPLKKGKIEKALNIHIKEHEEETMSKTAQTISVKQFRAAILKNAIECIPITTANYQDEMTMCLENYPYGNPPKRFHKKCIEIKRKVFFEALEKESIVGIYAKYQGKVIGLLEIFPREIIRKYGFLTGSNGNDEDYLTVGCYEVGFGIPRKEMIDELMFQLEKHYSKFKRIYLEGIGVFEWNEGFMPYWVYDKYGFHKAESIKENTVVMKKEIYKYR